MSYKYVKPRTAREIAIERYEKETRETLLESSRSLFAQPDSLLARVLKLHFPDLKFALCIGDIPSGGETLYSWLIDNERVVYVEIPRDPNVDPHTIPIEVRSLNGYPIPRRVYIDQYMDIVVQLMRDATEKE